MPALGLQQQVEAGQRGKEREGVAEPDDAKDKTADETADETADDAKLAKLAMLALDPDAKNWFSM